MLKPVINRQIMKMLHSILISI